MRSVPVLVALAVAGAAVPGRAAAEACREVTGHDGARVLEGHSRQPTRMAGSSIAALASFAGLTVTSPAEGPVSVGVPDSVDEAAFAAVGAAVPAGRAAPAVRDDRSAAAPAPARVPMCTGSADDDPRCRPFPPGPEGGPELSRAPLRSPAPRHPVVAGPARAARTAADPVDAGAARAGVRGRLERPPRG